MAIYTAALIAEVERRPDNRNGSPEADFRNCLLDCGPVSNPDGLRNQTEGGILQGTSRALVEEVTWDNRRVKPRSIGRPITACILITRCFLLSRLSL